MMNIIPAIKSKLNLQQRFPDRDMINIANIINSDYSKYYLSNPEMKECDTVFIDRLHKHSSALKLSFWEQHFEWKDLLNDYPQLSGLIMDFGCGSGHQDVFLARNGKYIYGVDLSPIGINIANYCLEKEMNAVKSNLKFELLDITAEKTNNICVDSVWSSHVFEHISNPKLIIEGIRQYVKPQGLMLISVPLGNAYDDPGHVNHFYTRDDLHNFLSPFINIIKIDENLENHVLRAVCQF
jgi:2-polyprenyl-3-methyl-5-hydroxy-6-metoxy-1,4-benzoquinol methylase